MLYQIDHEETLKLLIDAYDEGNHGFMDLAECTAEEIIAKVADKFKYEPPTSPFGFVTLSGEGVGLGQSPYSHTTLPTAGSLAVQSTEPFVNVSLSDGFYGHQYTTLPPQQFVTISPDVTMSQTEEEWSGISLTRKDNDNGRPDSRC